MPNSSAPVALSNGHEQDESNMDDHSEGENVLHDKVGSSKTSGIALANPVAMKSVDEISLNDTPRLPFPASPPYDSSAKLGSSPRAHKPKITFHTSASEFFDRDDAGPSTPPRRPTYSSLPPSPLPSDDVVFAGEPQDNELDHVEDSLRRFTSRTPKVAPQREDSPPDYNDDHVSTPNTMRAPKHEQTSGESRFDEKGEYPMLPEATPDLWSLLVDEAGDEEWDNWVVDGRWDRIANFLAIPLAIEKVTVLGILLCLDGFLYNFTILPIRSTFAVNRLAKAWLAGRSHLHSVSPSQLRSILRTILLYLPTAMLLLATDTSKMYHSVRGQDTIKLYVIFNALEIADRLCGAFGQDVLDTLFANETLYPSNKKVGKGRKRQKARPYFFLMLSLGYVCVHTLVFFYMLISLNVAINSYDYTLLSLLISNQFVEIKGSVFKKFDKENLFQILCADIVERFHLSLMLTVIALRNMIEMAGSEIAFLPKSFMGGKSLFDAIMSPVLFVMVSEMLVDWLKHGFIGKFNHIRASVYERFTDVLAKDVLAAEPVRRKNSLRPQPVILDQSPLVARRLGFASIPLACLILRLSAHSFITLVNPSHHGNEVQLHWISVWAWWLVKWVAGLSVVGMAWAGLLVIKILLGLALLSFATLRKEGMEAREAEDKVNDFGRSAIGTNGAEEAYNRKIVGYLDHPGDDLPEHGLASPVGTPSKFSQTPQPKDEGSKRKKWRLEEVERWTMVKRIW